MLAATQERTQVHMVERGFDDDGRLLALRDQFVHDTGAYTPRGLVVPLLSASMLAGPYRIPAVEVTFDSVYTNRVPVTPYRGAGQPQAVFVIERVMDLIARETGHDRAAVRFTNLVQAADMPYDVGLPNYRGSGNVVYDSGDYPAVLRRALEMANYERLAKECLGARREGRLLGLGVACYVELTGVGPFEGATIRADAAGRITVFTERANPERRIELGCVASVAAMATAAHGVAPGLEATHFFQPPDIAYSSGAHVALAEVDPETMRVRLRGYWVSHDSGRLINPTIVEGQIQGAVALGIGSALFEEIRYDAAGQPLCARYMDYALPRSDDVPPLQIDHLETPSPLNPLGFKGVGESGTLPVAAVVASAVEDALTERGIRVERMPLTPGTPPMVPSTR